MVHICCDICCAIYVFFTWGKVSPISELIKVSIVQVHSSDSGCGGELCYHR